MSDTEPPMTRFPVPDESTLPDDLQERLDHERERAGFLPNVFAAFAYRPRQFRAFFAYYDALVEESPLAREELEMVVVATSGANDCLYCVVAHGALLRIYADDPTLAEQLATNHRTANVGPAHRAMCDFAVQITDDPAEVTDDDIDRLREHGFSETEIWDIASTAALFNLSNRMAHVADMRPNEAFYELGRTQTRDG
jgi:uncharacterized peroxidase-related enzyme